MDDEEVNRNVLREEQAESSFFAFNTRFRTNRNDDPDEIMNCRVHVIRVDC